MAREKAWPTFKASFKRHGVFFRPQVAGAGLRGCGLRFWLDIHSRSDLFPQVEGTNSHHIPHGYPQVDCDGIRIRFSVLI